MTNPEIQPQKYNHTEGSGINDMVIVRMSLIILLILKIKITIVIMTTTTKMFIKKVLERGKREEKMHFCIPHTLGTGA